MKIKMWCLMKTKTNKPITINFSDRWSKIDVIGFLTRKSLMEAICDQVRDGEHVRRIEFEY